MAGACAGPWQTYDCEWGFGYLWRHLDRLGRANIIALAVMLLCVVVIVGRAFYRWQSARRQTHVFIREVSDALHSCAFDAAARIAERNESPVAAMVATWIATVAGDSKSFTLAESTGVASRAFWRSQKKLTARFICGLGALQSIAYTAPFLGLAGACEQIVNGPFRGVGMERHAMMLMMTTGIATSLVSTVTGLLVAIPASWSYNHVRGRVEMLNSEMSENALEIVTELNAQLEQPSRAERTVLGPGWYKPWKLGQRFQFAQSQPLRKRFSEMPAYGLLAAPALAFAVAAFMIFPSFDAPTGLSVRLRKAGEGLTGNSSSIPLVVIRLAGTGANRKSVLYVNAKETPWEKLDGAVRSKLTINPQPVIYVDAEDDVSWQSVANAVDVVKGISANVVLLTIPAAHSHTRVHGFGTPVKH
jgi:biopolymer transport protein ExbB/TolQ/biopolymer transport protein ExbD